MRTKKDEKTNKIISCQVIVTIPNYKLLYNLLVQLTDIMYNYACYFIMCYTSRLCYVGNCRAKSKSALSASMQILPFDFAEWNSRLETRVYHITCNAATLWNVKNKHIL